MSQQNYRCNASEQVSEGHFKISESSSGSDEFTDGAYGDFVDYVGARLALADLRTLQMFFLDAIDEYCERADHALIDLSDLIEHIRETSDRSLVFDLVQCCVEKEPELALRTDSLAAVLCQDIMQQFLDGFYQQSLEKYKHRLAELYLAVSNDDTEDFDDINPAWDLNELCWCINQNLLYEVAENQYETHHAELVCDVLAMARDKLF